jgi:LysM repeat protein
MFNPRSKFQLSPKLKLGVGRGVSKNQILKYGAIVCLLVAVGLTFNAFRILFSKNNNQTAAPRVLGVSDTKTIASTSTNGSAAVQFIQYTVQKGDTLFDISQKYNIDWATLATLNNIQSPFTVKPGLVLNIPKQ